MGVTKRRVIYGIAALVGLSLIALSVTTLAIHSADTTAPVSTTNEPERGLHECKDKKVFRVLFSQLVTVCQVDIENSQIYVGIDDYGNVNGTGIWFSLDEWNNFMRQLSLIEIVITDFQQDE